MAPWSLRDHLAALLSLGLLLTASGRVLQAQPAARASRDGVVAWLQHEEGLVRTIACRFEQVRSVTPPEMVPLIREICRKRGNENEYVSFVYTDQTVRKNSFVTLWWRKGPKERAETFNYFDDPEGQRRNLRAFDGQVIRSLEHDKTGLTAAIHSIKSAEWNSMNRTHPISLLYEFQNKPYSEIVAQGRAFDLSMVTREGKPYTRVSIEHPKFTWISFVLLFDDEHRLVEREVIVRMDPDKSPRVNEKHRLMEYQAHRDRSGEIISFPARALYSYYMGVLPDGRLVEYTTEDIRISDIQFNVDIPDQKFVLEIPKDAAVYDGLTGAGWLKLPESAQAAVDRTGKSAKWWTTLVAVSAVFLILVIIVVAIIRTKKRVIR